MSLPKTSAALVAAVTQQTKSPDESLYQNLPEEDTAILKAYLEGEDEQGRPYFSRSEKSNFLKKWKQKNSIKEDAVDETSMMGFSTASFRDKKMPPEQREFQRLLARIKDPLERKEAEKAAEQWGASNGDWPYKYIAKYHAKDMDMFESRADEALVIELNNKTLDESFLRSFGWLVQKALERMFGAGTSPINVKGTPSQIRAFSDTIGSEKRYMDAMEKYGLDSAHTFRNKSALEQAISKFERATGIKWPFTGK